MCQRTSSISSFHLSFLTSCVAHGGGTPAGGAILSWHTMPSQIGYFSVLLVILFKMLTNFWEESYPLHLEHQASVGLALPQASWLSILPFVLFPNLTSSVIQIEQPQRRNCQSLSTPKCLAPNWLFKKKKKKSNPLQTNPIVLVNDQSVLFILKTCSSPPLTLLAPRAINMVRKEA